MVALVLALLHGCGAPPEEVGPWEPERMSPSQVEAHPQREGAGAQEVVPAAEPAAEPTAEPVLWSVALALRGGGSSVPAGTTRVLTRTGLQRVQGEPCGEELRIPEEALLVLPPGPELRFPRAPANAAATVERASWRLAEVLGPRQGLVPGGLDESDPARHEGIRVRTVRKTRRTGPPMLVAVGDRGQQVAVALLDKGGAEVLASSVISSPFGPWERVGATPVWDLDDNGSLELVVWASSQQGTLRVVYSVDAGTRPSLTQRLVKEAELLSCP